MWREWFHVTFFSFSVWFRQVWIIYYACNQCVSKAETTVKLLYWQNIMNLESTDFISYWNILFSMYVFIGFKGTVMKHQWHFYTNPGLENQRKYTQNLRQNASTHWDRNKMVAILQTTFQNAVSWTKICEIRLRFRWSLFPRVQLIIFQHWFR